MKDIVSQRVQFIVVLVLVLIGPLLLRSLYSSSAAFQEAQLQQNSGNIEQAIESYRIASSWWIPFFSLSDVALERLLKIGSDENLSPDLRIEALRQAKRGVMSSRSFLLPFFRHRVGLYQRADSLLRILEPVSAERITEHYKRHPDYGWQVIAAISFCMWCAFLLLAIWGGVTPQGEIHLSRARLSCLSFAFFFALWLVGLSLA